MTPLDAHGRQVLTCAWCGTVRTREPVRGQPPAYCGDTCRREADNARQRARRAKKATS